jgi:MFS family permease
MLPAPVRAFLINRDFALYWVVRVASMMAFQMLAVAVGWQVYDLTGSMLDLGYIGLVSFLPAVLLVLLIGHVADRFDRRRVVQAGHGLEALVALLLAVGSWQGWLSVTHIFIGVFLLGIGKAFSAPTLSALLPGLVTKDELPRAVGASSAAMQAAIIGGPVLGGFLYVAGPTAVYATGTALFAATIVLLALVRGGQGRAPAPENPEDNSVFAGLRFIRSKPVVFGAISLDLFAVLLGGATAMLPVIAKDLLHTGPEGLGVLRAAPAVGALLVSAWLARHPIERRTGHVMFAGVAGFGLEQRAQRRLAAGGHRQQPRGEGERAQGEDDAGGAVQDRHHHRDLPAVDLQMRRQGALLGHRWLGSLAGRPAGRVGWRGSRRDG